MSNTLDGQLFAAARNGDVALLGTLLDAHSDKLHVRDTPYAWTLLHAAAQHGHLAAVDLLLARGLDVNVREEGDNTYALHWAAAGGHLDVVRRLVDAGGDVIGDGDDHALQVIGWATCWDGCDDAAHRAVADFLVQRGARHHIFSAVALGLGDEVRRIVADNPAALGQRMSRNEAGQTPLQFAVRVRRPAMVALLLELGADPLAVDADGQPVATYATTMEADRPVTEAIHARTLAELATAGRERRPSPGNAMALMASISLADWHTAERLLLEHLKQPEWRQAGVLHLLAKRGDVRGVTWLLEHGADPNAHWAHWDAEVTPLHLAAWGGSMDVARALLAAGADPSLRDSKHGGDARDWAEHFGRPELRRLLRAHMRKP